MGRGWGLGGGKGAMVGNKANGANGMGARVTSQPTHTTTTTTTHPTPNLWGRGKGVNKGEGGQGIGGGGLTAFVWHGEGGRKAIVRGEV